MKRKRKPQPVRKMHEIYIVFHEGDTEGEYLNLLRRIYRTSIKIKPIKEGTRISKARVLKTVESMKLDANDKITTFLMYDQDVENINMKLAEIPGIKLVSNPCFELWYILHITSKVGYMSSDECYRKLKQTGEPWTKYEKGNLSVNQQTYLSEKKSLACSNARKLKNGENPSCSVFKLLEKLDKEGS